MGSDVIPIPGTTSIEHLDQNLAARYITLTAKQVEEIKSLIPVEQVQGFFFFFPISLYFMLACIIHLIILFLFMSPNFFFFFFELYVL